MDGESCSASSRCDASGGSTGSWTYGVAAFGTALALFAVMLPYIWRLAGSTLGLYLRKRTQSQRQFLLDTMAADEKRFQEQKKQQQTAKKNDSSDDDWENVEAEAAASAGNGEKGASDWDGIVGFFHPFW